MGDRRKGTESGKRKESSVGDKREEHETPSKGKEGYIKKSK